MVDSTDNTEAAAGTPESEARGRPSWLAVATGLNASMAISYIACKPPQTYTLSLRVRLFTSAICILVACLAGMVGTWIALSRDSRRQFRSLALCGVRGWVFFPAMMMFLRERSVWTPFVAILSAALIAVYWSRLTGALTHRSSEGVKIHKDVEKSIFITQLCFEPISWASIGVSLCLYGAFLSAVKGNLSLLTLLLGAGAFLLVSQITTARSKIKYEQESLGKRSRSYSWVAVAFCCAFVALSASSGTSDLVWQMRAFHVWEQTLSRPRPVKQQASEEHSSEGYRAIVLWPLKKKEKVISSPPSSIHPSSRSNARPWIIPFYGPYWYFKTPGESPGPRARITRGDPLKVNVRSTNRAPLLMEAHQSLAAPVALACCREIQVVFKNAVPMGATDVGILLTDSHSKGKPSQSLGIKYVASNGVDQALGITSPVEEAVSFPLPKSGKISRFDQITVILLPDAKHSTIGRKVAIEKFVMIPN